MMKKTRVQFDLTPKELEQMDAICEAAGYTRNGVFDSAMYLLGWAIRETQQGAELLAAIPGANKYKQLEMPTLINFKK